MGLGIFIVYSLITHLIFFVAVFDIYFTSPIIHGVKQFQQNIEPPASRLVLLVADGLRADKFFELNEENISRAPFLRYCTLQLMLSFLVQLQKEKVDVSTVA